jgi:K+-transporting ATPase KdpF subunit
MKERIALHPRIHDLGKFRISNSEFRILEWQQKLPLAIFMGLCVNLLIAPVVYAAADGALERSHAYALGLLGLVTLGLVVYLFVVVFQPERF